MNIHKAPAAIEFVNPTTLFDPRPYAFQHIAVVKNFSKIIHLSGQGGENIHGELSLNFKDQLIQTFKNIETALNTVGVDIDSIAMLRILMVKHDEKKHQMLIQEMNKIWKNNAFPACTLIPVPSLALENMQIEIEATACCA